MKAPEFWYPDMAQPNPRIALAARCLVPLGWLYGGLGRMRRSLTRPERPEAPVICIGNLTVGGTGKTPLAITMGRHLIEQGLTPMYLTRGYGGRKKGPLIVDRSVHGARDVGDEPLLLAGTAPTVVSSNRPKGACHAIGAGATVIVMDDGFQNPSLDKILSILVIDGETLLGNGMVVPAGPLRESIKSGFARTDAIVVMGGAGATQTTQRHLDDILARFSRPVFRANLAPDPERLRHLLGHRYVAFAGIGRPSKFFTTARDLGLDVAAQRAFPDHHAYTDEELASLDKDARRHSAMLLTTEKDAMRLPPERRARVSVLPVQVAFDEPDAFWSFLRSRLSRYVPSLRADRPLTAGAQAGPPEPARRERAMDPALSDSP